MPPQGAPAPAMGRLDRGLVTAHVVTPLATAALFTRVLTGGWSWALYAAFAVLMAIGLRPAMWSVAAGLRSRRSRRVLLVERRDNAASISFVAMALLGLGIMDVFGLPGYPHWTNQPEAGLLLAAVAVYLVWLATYARIPDEVRRGWSALLERKDVR